MKLPYKLILLFLSTLFLISASIYGQGVTTASISGNITDENGQPLFAATIIAVHLPTGTPYGTTSRDNGNFNLLGLRVGGPYSLKISYVGYHTETRDSIWLQLGQNLTVNFKLIPETVQLGEVSVIGQRSSIINNNRTGSAQNVSNRQIQQIPTINRNLQDLIKLSPLFSGVTYQAAGRNNRYNNIQLNGTQFNDLFGLGSTGTPAGQAGANPISLDAIQEFQIVIAPYDVRYGGFTGGGINAITRSGANTFEGSLYGFGRNQSFVGLSPDSKKEKFQNFSNFQEGFRLGGPIAEDKLFFFINGELTQYTYPWANLSLTSQGPSNTQSLANQMKNILASKYNFSAGSAASLDAKQPSGKLFARVDWNISNEHKLTLSYNYLNANSDNDYNNTRSANNALSFDSYLYLFENTTNNVVAQMNSTFGNNMSNELILGYTAIRDNRKPKGSAMPLVQVNEAGLTMYAGPDRYSSANYLNQDIFEFTDNFTFTTRSHVITIGTHNELFSFENLFMRSYYGYYIFNSLADLDSGIIASYQKVSSRTSDPLQPAKFNANQFGFYAQDEASVLPNLKLTIGVRLDIPVFPTDPAKNDSLTKYFPKYSTTNKPSGNLLFSPRLGFNYDITGDRETQIRGGIGIFTGRVPYVWMSNNYGNTGTYYAEVSGTPTVNAFNSGFSADPYNQPTAAQLGLTPKLRSEIDIVDKNLKMPQVLRIDAGIDRQLPFEFVGTLEFLYSKNINEMSYQLINLNPQTNIRSEGRFLFDGTNNGNGNFYNILYLQNTSEGYQYDITAQVQRNVLRGFSTNAGYTYGRAYDINGVSSSQANSQMAYNPIAGNPNNPPLATSDWEIQNRIFVSLTYTDEFFTNAPTAISLFFNGQSGTPFSFIYNGDVNGDGFNSNDLFYIPKNDADIMLGSVVGGGFIPNAQMYKDFDNFVNNNDYLKSHRGQIAERNSTHNPWYNQLDVRIVQDIPLVDIHRVQISLDILNVLNLLNSDWGWYEHTPLPTYQIVKLEGHVDLPSQHNVYSFKKPDNNTPWSADNILSRWAMQLGLRYYF